MLNLMEGKTSHTSDRLSYTEGLI